MLKAGDKAPAFSLKDQDGRTVALKDLKGKWVVIYFYPRDNTPGCTREACDFQDAQAALKKAGAIVLGVSKDSEESHQKFAGKFKLTFPLLVDQDHGLADAFGAWGEKSLYGRKFMGMIRCTFLIDPKGNIAQVWPKVKVNGHAEEVQEALAAAQGA